MLDHAPKPKVFFQGQEVAVVVEKFVSAKNAASGDKSIYRLSNGDSQVARKSPPDSAKNSFSKIDREIINAGVAVGHEAFGVELP